MNIEIANRLVNLRKRNHLSQEALAERLGISRQAVSKWERAEASPDTDNLILLARLYKVSLDELLLTEDEIPEPGGEVQAPSQGEGAVWADEADASGFSLPGDSREPEEGCGQEEGNRQEIWENGIQEQDGQNEGRYYPMAAAIIICYLFIGFVFNAWHPGWLMFLLIPIIWILALLVEFVLGPVLYGVYEKDATLQEGMAGSEAGGELVAAIYLSLGIFFDAWHPGWIIFLTIPLYYPTVSWLKDRARRRAYKQGRKDGQGR